MEVSEEVWDRVMEGERQVHDVDGEVRGPGDGGDGRRLYHQHILDFGDSVRGD